MTVRPRLSDSADWLHPPSEEQGLRRYAQTLRERWLIVVVAVVATTAAATAYAFFADDVYETQADLLVTPISNSDPNLGNLGLLRESADPTRDVETAARLVATLEVADRVRKRLDLTIPARSLLESVNAEPVAQSNIVAVTASASTAIGAADLANAFAEEAVEQRTNQLHEQIDVVLPSLRERVDAADPSTLAGQQLAAQLAQLQTLADGEDPTIRTETAAQPPTSAVAPRPLLSIAAGLLAGLILGIGAAFAWELLDPRLRREEQLRRLYRLPILGRIPREPGKRHRGPLGPRNLSPVAGEAYRTLRSTVTASWRASSGEIPQVILVTSASGSEGKTTTAVNMASSLAAAGRQVILIEADLRRPTLADSLQTNSGTPGQGVVSVLIENATLEQALVPLPGLPKLCTLTADYAGGWIADLFALPAARRMIDEARLLADYVIIDSPPLTEVIDALPLAEYADTTLLVVRLGRTRLKKLSHLGELLAENGVRPVGFTLVGTERPSRADYRYYAEGHRPLVRDGARPPAERAASPTA